MLIRQHCCFPIVVHGFRLAANRRRLRPSGSRGVALRISGKHLIRFGSSNLIHLFCLVRVIWSGSIVLFQ
ncbi:MAG: hypothetical protein Q8870_02540 [Sweet potato little leaf phytoplasma]|nr:hypothetical protein [Sweet potato little leaf phytoplasma]